MVSTYVKALVITAVLFVGNFFLVKYVDDSRNADIAARLAAIDEEMQSSQVLLLYLQSTNDSATACLALEAKAKEQISLLYGLAGQLESSEASNMLGNISPLKRKFILSNTQLLLYVTQLQAACGYSDMVPVLYFYPDREEGAACMECRAQADMLTAWRNECKNVRVFAFPTNADMAVLEILKKKYGVTKTPAVVVNEKLYSGLTPLDRLREGTACTK